MQDLTCRIIEIIKSIPYGKVCTYGAIAKMAGSPQASRQVARILHSCTGKYQLPWHRVINSKGEISLPEMGGKEIQIELLRSEGIYVLNKGKIDLKEYLWLSD